jgi:hypothetical protein
VCVRVRVYVFRACVRVCISVHLPVNTDVSRLIFNNYQLFYSALIYSVVFEQNYHPQ